MPKKTETVKQKRSSLIKGLVFFVGLVIVLVNVIQVLFVTSNAKKDIVAEDIDMYNNMIDGYSAAVVNTLEGYFKELNVYYHADIMEDGALDEVITWLQNPEHEDMRGEFDYIMVAGPDGKAYTDIGTKTDISERDYFQAVMQEGKDRYVDNPVISKTTGQPVIHITRALKDRYGRTFAMLAGVVNVNLLTTEINRIKIGANGYGYLLAGDGTVITHPVKDFIMQKNFITGITGGKEGRNGDMIAVAEAMAAGEEGAAWINANGRSGKDLIVYSPISGTPWSLGLSIPDKQIYDLVNAISRLLLIFAAVCVVALVLISAFLLLRSLKPLQIVESAITGIASGDADLTKRIEINSNNEIGFVVKGFNAFASKLQTIIGDVKNSKDELMVAGENLSSATEDTSSSITEIIANIESMKHQIDSQSQSVNQTAGAVNEIASNIESLEHMIEAQSSGVTQASAAVEQMIGNISSVNMSMEKMA
ncbi:cache domain-containing protein, partial [Treponema sp.]|uniref:cache domain-containing protein n=1 Tax=Treponema sp. TaxID=166 RepID=UPI00388EF183